jgi:hypothetical protein
MKKALLFVLALIAVGCGASDRQSELRELADSVSRLVMFEELDEWIARWEETQDSIASRCEGARPAAAQTDLEEGECTEDGYSQSLSETLGSGEDMVSVQTKAISWLWEDPSEVGSMKIFSERTRFSSDDSDSTDLSDIRTITRRWGFESGEGLSFDRPAEFELSQSGVYTEEGLISLEEIVSSYYENGQPMSDIWRSWSADESYDGSWEMYHENGQSAAKAIITDGVLEVLETYYDNGQLESKQTLTDSGGWQMESMPYMESYSGPISDEEAISDVGCR